MVSTRRRMFEWVTFGVVMLVLTILGVSTKLPQEYLSMVEDLRNDTVGLLNNDSTPSTPCFVEGLQSISQYQAYLHQKETVCEKMVQFGGRPPAPASGEKYICLDQRFNIKANNCIVFSFGINDEWSFEDDVDKLLGCKVYAYDPTMKQKDYQRSPNIKFMATGIANYKGMKKIGMEWKGIFNSKVDRFENMVRDLGLTGKEIDYIKLDVELLEIEFFQDMLLNSPHVLKKVKQIGVEIHDDYFRGNLSPVSNHQVFWNYFMLLRCAGFRIIQSRDTPGSRWREVVFAQERQW